MNIFSQFIDIVYPPRCPLCRKFLGKGHRKGGQAGTHFCGDCLHDFSALTSPRCTICGRPFTRGTGADHRCEPCLRKKPFYDRLGAPYLFQGSLMDAIHQFKYNGRSYLAGSLGQLMTAWAGGWLPPDATGLMMPIPLHPKRLRERGFNQSLLLARVIASGLGFDLDFLSLRRIRYTRPQTGLDPKARRKNVRRAFELEGSGPLKGRTIILVDDVATTGNTINECARVLKRAGAAKVIGLVLARTGGRI